MKNILLHHIPKNAGTAFAAICKQTLNMDVKRFYTPQKICETLECSIEEVGENALTRLSEKKEIKNSQYTPCIDVQDIENRELTFLYAHEFKEAVDSLFKKDNWNTICIFRNPLERFFSMIAQRQRNNCIDRFDNCHEKYQFYFFYREWCRDENLLKLNDQNSNNIFNKACEYLDKFDYIIDQKNLNNAFEKILTHRWMVIVRIGLGIC
jgi:hypothetical protein